MSYPVVLLAHNIRSVWNVGSFFRTADAFGVSHIHLTGYTTTPPSPELHKTALGADEWIPWSKDENPFDVIKKRKKEGYEIISLELSKESTPLSDFKPTKPVCLILGNEILGVADELQKESDHTVHIPMSGKKESLNVVVALGIALYGLRSSM